VLDRALGAGRVNGASSENEGCGERRRLTEVSHVHLIYEFNCYLSEPAWWDRVRLSLGLITAAPCRGFATVWAAGRPLGPDEDYTQVARRVVGPLPDAEAERVVDELRSVLEAAGVQVTTETVADD
jgi:hypothetical protein